MARKAVPENLIKTIDRLLELPLAGVDSAKSYVERVNSAGRELLEVLEPRLREELAELVAKFEVGAAKLLQSLANLSFADTRLDWKRLSERDLLGLKDDALAMREFLTTHAEVIKHAWERAARVEISFEELIGRLHSERAVSEQTWALLVRYAQAKGARSRELKDLSIVERLVKISCLLSGLREARKVARAG